MSNSLKSKLSFFIILFILIWAVFLYSVIRVILRQTEPFKKYQQPDGNSNLAADLETDPEANQQPDGDRKADRKADQQPDGPRYARLSLIHI